MGMGGLAVLESRPQGQDICRVVEGETAVLSLWMAAFSPRPAGRHSAGSCLMSLCILIPSLIRTCITGLSLCCCSVSQSCPTLCHPMGCSTPGFPVLRCLPEFAQTTESVMPPNHLLLCCPLLLLPSIPPSIRVSSNELSLCIRWVRTLTIVSYLNYLFKASSLNTASVSEKE